jgi:hypothetical protein
MLPPKRRPVEWRCSAPQRFGVRLAHVGLSPRYRLRVDAQCGPACSVAGWDTECGQSLNREGAISPCTTWGRGFQMGPSGRRQEVAAKEFPVGLFPVSAR